MKFEHITAIFLALMQALTLAVVVGMWVGGINAMEKQLLVWLADAEAKSASNHNAIIQILNIQSNRMGNIEGFLQSTHSDYVPLKAGAYTIIETY